MELPLISTESEDDENSDEETKRPMTAAERQRKRREKARLIKEGKFSMAPLDRAKFLLNN